MDQLTQQFSKMESTLVDLKAEKELYEAKHCAADQETIMLQKNLHALELELKNQQYNLHNLSFISRELTEIKSYCYQTQDLTRKWANSFHEITDYCMKNMDSMVFIDPQFENNADEIELLKVNLEDTILASVGGSSDDMDRIKRMSEDFMYTVEADAAKDLQNEKEELDLLTKHLVNDENLLRFGVLDRELEIPAFNFTLKNAVFNNVDTGEKISDNETQKTPPKAFKKHLHRKGTRNSNPIFEDEHLDEKSAETEAQQTPPIVFKKVPVHRKGARNSNPISEDDLHQHEMRYSGNSFEQEFDNSNQEIQDQKRKRNIENIDEMIDETNQNKKSKQEPIPPQSKGNQNGKVTFIEDDNLGHNLEDQSSQCEPIFSFSQLGLATQDPMDNMDFFDINEINDMEEPVKTAFG